LNRLNLCEPLRCTLPVRSACRDNKLLYTHESRVRRVRNFEIIATRELCMSLQCADIQNRHWAGIFRFFCLIITTVAWKRDRVCPITNGWQQHPTDRGKRHRRHRARFSKLDFLPNPTTIVFSGRTSEYANNSLC